MTADVAIARKINDFLELFAKWNRRINLSAAETRRDLDEHVEDSRHVLSHLEGARRVLDVGSGGGFPVVVAAIALPSISFVGLEPIHKKHAFLRTAARELSLPNLEPMTQRLEDHHVRDYDIAMSRATFDLVEWLAAGTSFVHPGGRVIGFEAVPRLDLPPAVTRHPYALGSKQRAIVVIGC